MKRQMDIKDLASLASRYVQIGTKERHDKGDIIRRGSSMAMASDPLMVDKLYANGVINDWQRSYGIQIYRIWLTSGKPNLRSMNLDRQGGISMEMKILDRMSAQDELFKTMSHLRKLSAKIISAVVFEEIPIYKTENQLKIGHGSLVKKLPNIFEELGIALQKMRDFKDDLLAKRIKPMILLATPGRKSYNNS